MNTLITGILSDMTYNEAVSDTLCIDIGNSRLKIFDGNTTVNSISNKSDMEIELMNYLCNHPPQNIIYSSVNSTAEAILNGVLYRLKINSVKASELMHHYNEIDFSEIKGMGTDRKLGLTAALSEYCPPLITIDFGTCITINIVDNNRKCLGGNIFPGLQTQANALNYFTSALPQIKISYTNEIIGNNTESAMLSAIINITLRGLNSHILNIVDTYFKDMKVKIIFTGGISKIARNYSFDFDYQIDEALVLKGMWKLKKYLSPI